MSEYTTEVRFICETLAGFDMSKGYGVVEDILDQTWDKVFDFDFPLFDNSYKKVLCKKILRHYYTREIGFETVGLWKLKLFTKMQEIMPYYNKLYESETYKYNPMYDADYTKTHEGEDKGSHLENNSRVGNASDEYNKSGNNSKNESGSADKTRWDTYSDTPQGSLTNVENGTYLTDARKITDNESDSMNGSAEFEENGENSRNYNETVDIGRQFNSTNEYVEHVVGKMPGSSYSKMIKEYRETLLNIDMKIIDELSNLFMLIW